MPETTTGRPLLCSRPLRLVAAASGLLVASALIGCAATENGAANGGDPREPAVTLAGESAGSPSGSDPNAIRPTRVGDMLIEHSAFRDLGLRWDWTIPGSPASGTAVSTIHADDDVVYALDERNVLRLFSAADGTRRWGVEVSDPLERFVGVNRSGDRLLVSSQTELFVFTLDGGNLVQRSSYGQSVGTAPVRNGSQLIYGTPTGELMGFNFAVAGGQKAWGNANQRGPIVASPVVIGAYVGAVSDAGDVLFCDARTGQIVARESIFGGTASTPATDGLVMVVAGLDQSVWAFLPDGRLVWRHRTDRPIRGTPVIHDGVAYCQLGDGSQIALHVRDNEPLGIRGGDILWQTPGLGGTLVHASGAGLLFWDEGTRTLTLADTARGDAIASVALDAVEHVFADDLDGGNLYAATRSGWISKFNVR